ncbi:MAG: flippase [bacterium]
MNLAGKVAWNTIVQFLSKIISIVLGLFTIGIMTRYLGPSNFGEYTTILTFISFFAVAADLGLTLVTVQMISVPNVDQNKTLSNLFSLRLISALVMLLAAPVFVWLFPYSQAIKIGVAIAWSSYFFVALNQILIGFFQKELRLDKASIAEIVSRIVLFIGIVLTVKYDLGLNGILWFSVISSFLNFGLLFYYSRPYAKISLNFNWEIWLEITKKSWPIGVTIFFNLIYLRTDILLLSIFKSQNDVGVYGAAYKVIDVLITLPFIFAGIVLPIMTSSWLNKNHERFQMVVQRSFDLMSLLAIPQFFGAYFLAGSLMSLVAGKEFAISGPILQILMAASSIVFIGTVFSHAVIAVNRQKNIIGAYAFVAATSLIGYLIFIPKFSYFGAAWVTIYSELAIALASFYIVYKESGFVPHFKVFNKSLLASIIMSLGIIALKHFSLLTNISVAIFSYFISLYMLKGITKQDILELVAKS